ncbi:MAG: indolepyruvate ferredoxin oxidoreductase family protein [Bryobacteraceae bacterium]|nr:indolepyruvate ferredoxin oxidoreductase family protein [Bryobacteraceae bacterium]
MDLREKYTRIAGKAYLTGIQALVRLPLDQMRLDRAAGLRTAALISGYEGSPLGGYDLALGKEKALLAEHDVHHWPAVNEDLGATAIYGAQILETMGPARADGVAGIWYGKGPGVDRSGDIFRHANLAGTSRLGCALVLAGDDHASKSSTIPHQSDFSLMNWAMPVLVPGNPQEILDLGLAGLALSRYSGAWVGLKLVTNVCDGGATLDLDLARHQFTIPDAYQKKAETRLLAPWTIAAEAEAMGPRLEAAKRFATANRLNRTEGPRDAKIGIATAGKPYYDVMQVLGGRLEELGIRVAKFGMTFPLETAFAREFAEGLDLLLVIEEKRAFLESHLRDALYDLPTRPRILGKFDRDGQTLVPNYNELDPDLIATVLERVLGRALVEARVQIARKGGPSPVRLPNFCSGCPHNRSTMLLEGQVAGGGTGCHGMGILLPDSGRSYQYATQMGGEGVPWIGMSPFSERKHIFQNLGDGTYFHSGSLAVQACVAAKVNITFKLLYNGHVAMTGGQAPSGVLAVPELTQKLAAEGVAKIVVLAEDTGAYAGVMDRLAKNVELRDRMELDRTLAELPTIPGVTVMIYDQECAAEKRRARSRGKAVEPTKRLLIHEEVCEGCGDCVKQSNCMSLQPVATPLGEKMSIHQSSCNKDYTCALGDCPSFVQVEIAPGSGLPRTRLPALSNSELPLPKEVVTVGEPGYRILSPGIGGTGVITIHALLATAAVMDGFEVSTLDQTGLAQKGGAVVSHLTLSPRPWRGAARIHTGQADLILGFDALGAVSPDNLKCAHPARTVAVLNTHVTPTSEAIRKRLPMPGPQQNVDLAADFTRRERNLYVDATGLAERLFSSHLAVNMFLLGAAWQAGLIPLTLASLEASITLNGVEAERNLEALRWGRLYYLDAARVEATAKPVKPVATVDYYAKLTAYQNRAYAEEWKSFVEAQPAGMREVVGRYLYKAMAYKDEYEVARLLTATPLPLDTFAKPLSYSFILHPPILRALGWKKKITFGAWSAPAMRLMGKLKFLRGTGLDLFGYAAHRREERELIGWYRDWVEKCALRWESGNEAEILEMLSLLDQVRGYGDIKSASIARVKTMMEERYGNLAGERAGHLT